MANGAPDPVAAFLAAVPTEVRRGAWSTTIAGWLGGMDLPAGVTEADVRAGLGNYLATMSEPTFDGAHVRAFVVGPHRTRTQPPAARPRRPVSFHEV